MRDPADLAAVDVEVDDPSAALTLGLARLRGVLRGDPRGAVVEAVADPNNEVSALDGVVRVRRAVQPQLGLLKSTMLQLDSAFTEKAYGATSFSDFVEKLKKAGSVNVSGQGGRYIIERKTSSQPDRPTPKPDEALPPFRDVLETHRMELENGVTADELANWVHNETNIDPQQYGFQQFSEFLMFAQDRLVVRVEPDEERGLVVSLGAEFYPPALPEPPASAPAEEEEEEKQPIVEGQPSLLEPNPPPAKPKKVSRPRKSTRDSGNSTQRTTATRRPRKKKPE